MGIVGGMFGLADLAHNPSPPPFIGERSIFLVNGRSGIAVLVEQLSPSSVWTPSYLCHTVLAGADRNGARTRFYEVDYDLQVASDEWLDRVDYGDLVIFIDYFGRPFDASLADRARRRGAWVLEDACQALLSDGVGRHADFVLYSPRKFLGIPDGGILVVNAEEHALDDIELAEPPMEWWLKAHAAFVLRREFDIHGGDRRWFELYKKTEAGNPVGRYSMSRMSQDLLMHAFDYADIARRRIENHRTLAGELAEIALYPDLPAGVVPLGFPVRMDDRDRVREALFHEGVYPPVHWPIAGVVPEEFEQSHALARDIMMIPCDQRYEAADMERVAQLVLGEMRG